MCHCKLLHRLYTGKAIRTNHTLRQSIYLGNLSDACITTSDTCGPEGAAVAFLMRVIDCPSYGGIMLPRDGYKGGFYVFCIDRKIRYMDLLFLLRIVWGTMMKIFRGCATSDTKSFIFDLKFWVTHYLFLGFY